MSHDAMLREAVDAISKGQRIRARDLLTRLLRTDQTSAEYWLWMSSVVDTQQERIYCLESALKLDPTNTAARQGLIMLGRLKPGEEIKPVPPPKRSTAVELEELEQPKTGFRKIWANPRSRGVFVGGSFVLVLAIILGSYFSLKASYNNRLAAVLTARVPTATLRPFRTNTPGPTQTLVVRSPTPTFRGPTPLWVFLEATYTPVPPYVSTPHPRYESFRTGMRAYERGDYEKMLTYMKQASDYEPDSADLKYFVGESYRFLEDYPNALDYYNQAIELDPNFGAAYLGRARVERRVDPEANTLGDIDQAITLDASMGEAYLERAGYYLEIGQPISATVDLDSAEGLIPYSPYLFMYRSQASLAQGDIPAAVDFAKQAYDTDMTLLPVYLTLAEAYMADGNYPKALNALDTYLIYVTDKPDGFIMKGRMYLEQDKYEQAVEQFDKALELDNTRADAYYYRGLTHMQLEEGQEAVNDLVHAQSFDLKNFQINLDLGRALMLADRNADARDQFDATMKLAVSNLELASVYYYRALAFEHLNATTSAGRDWLALLELEGDDIPQDWRTTAQQHLDVIYPPTPTVTVTSTATLKPTKTPTPAPATKTPTPAKTATRKP